MMDMLAGHDGRYGRGMLGGANLSRILELGLLARETLLDVRVAAMVNILVLDTHDIVRVLFGQHFAVVDGLHRGMVVVLVHFAVDGGGDLFVAGGSNVFLLDGRIDRLGVLLVVVMERGEFYLVHAGIVLAVFIEKGRDGGLGFFHDEDMYKEVSGKYQEK